MFPKNAWYVACTPDELAGKPLGRRICDEPMVFYRGEDGRVAALEDFCPHRGAPLSLGFVEDGVLVCGYHGLAMGEDGRTRAMPGQRVRGFPCIRRFPVQERHGFVWVWPGAEEQADAALIPRLEWAESPDWAYAGTSGAWRATSRPTTGRSPRAFAKARERSSAKTWKCSKANSATCCAIHGATC